MNLQTAMQARVSNKAVDIPLRFDSLCNATHGVLQNIRLHGARSHHYKSAVQFVTCKAQTDKYNELCNVQVPQIHFKAIPGGYLKLIRADHETLKQQHGGTIANEAVPLHLS